MLMQYYKTSLIWTAIGLGLAFWIGGPTGLFIASILAILEVSLSFDNAIVNAKELEHMDATWRHRFLTWGMAIAVFGMRIIFPLLIVCIVAGITPWAALDMAMFQPEQYKTTLTSAHINIMGFGGAFLFMVFLKFFLDGSKDSHWLDSIEHRLTKLGVIDMIEAGIILVATVIMSHFIEKSHGIEGAYSFMTSSIMGIVTYIIVDSLHLVLGEEDEMTGVAIRAGLASFVYLEVLDASFSFDGVIGAFAVTNNIWIMAIGLGIGACFVRSMTLMLVDKGTLAEYKFLEHGAFWAIGTLAMIMFVSTIVEIPEVVTGGLGAAFIMLALYSSIKHNKLEQAII